MLLRRVCDRCKQSNYNLNWKWQLNYYISKYRIQYYFVFFTEKEGANHLWDSLLRLNQNQFSSKIAQNKTKDLLRDNQKRNRRVRKIRNKLCSRKCSRLNPARLNESDIIEFKKESLNTTISNEIIENGEPTQPLFNVQYRKTLWHKIVISK